MRFAAPAVLISALAFAASGCGSSPSAAEKWASSLCTDIGNWKQQLQKEVNDAQAKLQSPGAGTIPAVKTDVQDAVAATQTLRNELKALGKPDTESGAQAKQQLDALVSQLENAVTMAKQTVANLPTNAGTVQVVSQLSSLAPTLQSLVTTTKSSLSSIQAAGSDMKDGFDKADSCKQFR